MLRELQRYLAAGNPIELIYLDSRNRISKRVVRLLSGVLLHPQSSENIQYIEHSWSWTGAEKKSQLGGVRLRVTKRQREVLKAILQFTEQHKYPPTVRELGELVGLSSPSTIHGILTRLKLNGLITWEPTHPRTIKVIKKVDAS